MNPILARSLIEHARADGVSIVVEADRVKLRGAPAAVADWASKLRPYKSQIVEVARTVRNEGRQLPGVVVLTTDAFDVEEFGLECLSWLHAQGLVLALEGHEIVMCGAASRLICEEASALVELHHEDLMLALRAQKAARSAIDRAALAE